MRQGEGETVQVWVEHILDLAEEVFPGKDIGQPLAAGGCIHQWAQTHFNKVAITLI